MPLRPTDLRTLVSKVARRLGWSGRRHRHKANSARAVIDVECPTDAIYRSGNVVFEISLDQCLYPFGFSFGPEGWHPFVQTLRAYSRDRSLTYEQSPLRTFYERFQPVSMLELLYPPDVVAARKHSPLGSIRLDEYEAFLPWSAVIDRARAEPGTGLPTHHGHQGFGPVSPEKGRLEFNRLRNTFESIERHGYRPHDIGPGDIKGYFVSNGPRSRFIIREGQHRMAALAALGFVRVRVGFVPGFTRVVDIGTVDQWPLVRNGPFDRDLATRLVDIFLGDGMPWVAEVYDLALESQAHADNATDNAQDNDGP